MDTRQAAIYLSRTRVGIGLAFLAAPRTVGKAWLGPDLATSGAAAMTRVAGIREVTLGAGAAIALSERKTGANWLSMTAVADGVDAAILLLGPGLPWRARLVGVVAAGAAVAQLLAAKELARDEGLTAPA